ncbi:hypothetical protein HBB16_08265 [Pseudonocardia sp. MCCB 268]|nr:hypothetical protein [Pseudonocardia cytotoxica]
MPGPPPRVHEGAPCSPPETLTLNHLLAHRAETDGDRIGLIWESADGGGPGMIPRRPRRARRTARRRSQEHGVAPATTSSLHMTNQLRVRRRPLRDQPPGRDHWPTIASYAVDEAAPRARPRRGEGRDLRPGPSWHRHRGGGAVSATHRSWSAPTGWSRGPHQPPPAADVAPPRTPRCSCTSSGTTARPKAWCSASRRWSASGEMNAQHQRLRPGPQPLRPSALPRINALTISLLSTMA